MREKGIIIHVHVLIEDFEDLRTPLRREFIVAVTGLIARYSANACTQAT